MFRMQMCGRMLFIFWLALFIVHSPRCCADTPPPDYAEYYRLSLSEQANRIPPRERLQKLRPGKLAGDAAIYICTWEATNDPTFLRAGKAHWEMLMKRLTEHPDELWNDFHVVTPAAQVVSVLSKRGIWTNRDEAQFNPIAENAAQAYLRSSPMTHGNRDVSRVAGIALLSTLYPDNTTWHAVRVRVNNYLTKYLELGDLDENSGNYSSLGLLRFVDAVQAMDREAEFASERWRRVFERYRDIVAPSGRMPEWGDDYFKTNALLSWIYLFEYAALQWHDASFAAVARTMHHTRPVEDVSFDRGDWLRGVGLLKLSPTRIPPTTHIPDESIITDRITADGRQVVDKLVLRSPASSESPMVMMDLYCRGDHTHFDKRGAITYYEVGKAPLFFNYGRYRQSAAYANLVFATAEDEEFPHQVWRQDTWYTQSVPTDRLPAPKGLIRVSDLRELESMSIRNHPTPGAETLVIDNIRLEGPAGTKMVDDCEQSRWTPESECSLTQGPGPHAIELRLSRTLFDSPNYNLQFSTKDYNKLKYDLKYLGDKKPRVQCRFPGGYDSWHFIGQSTLISDVSAADVHEGPNVSRASVFLAPYLTHDTTLARQLALLRDGTLIVRDDLRVGESLSGHVGGPLWQMYSISSRGDNWFDAPPIDGYSAPKAANVPHTGKHMLVYFDQQPGRRFGLSVVPGGKGGTIGGDSDLRTAFASEALQGGQTSTFVTVVVPHSTDELPDEIVGSIAIEVNDSGSVTVQLDEAVVSIAPPAANSMD